MTSDDSDPDMIELIQKLKMTTIRNPKLDETWRLVGREATPSFPGLAHLGDCYVFRRRGGTRPTDVWSIAYMPVERFWGG